MSRSFLILLHITVYTVAFAMLHGPWFSIVFAGCLIWASVVDFERFEIPDLASIFLWITGLAVAFGAGVFAWHLAATVIWGALFWGVAAFYRQVRGWDGLGFGDVKLIAGIAAWTGFYGTIWVVFMAAIAGIGMLLISGVSKAGKFQGPQQSAVAFGPFLCLSAWAIWLIGVS
ncbi:prepilin peptidase [Parasulfitobacter algicola]|uniref:Prepilin peptidase n=1 Tax=Parasulfitobacter algicola TaxID=2614809 RepID=A0ABX2IVP2_9RHOB|nr:A24 family peptidase [Sulfitobacter algicola]NSX56999.1 prepilin peptidase [Sulfitobacter algicola]